MTLLIVIFAILILIGIALIVYYIVIAPDEGSIYMGFTDEEIDAFPTECYRCGNIKNLIDIANSQEKNESKTKGV